MLTVREDKRIGEILVEADVITEQQLWDALCRQRENGGRLGRSLVELGYLEEDEIASYVAEQRMKARCTDIARLVETSEYNGKERRRYPRFNLKLRVRYEFKDEVNVNPSVNISRGGIMIKSKSPIPVNAHIVLRIELPTLREGIIVISRVVWAEKPDNADTYAGALSFSSMDSCDNKALTAFIESLGKPR